jgi:ribosomal protein S19
MSDIKSKNFQKGVLKKMSTSRVDKGIQIIRNRDMIINKALLNKIEVLLVYKGKSFTKVTLKKKMIGCNAGEFSLTKRLGSKIHNSARNKKKKTQLNKK